MSDDETPEPTLPDPGVSEKPVPRRSHSLRSRVVLVLVILLPWFGLGALTVRVSGEPDRTQKAILEVVQKFCPFFGDIGSVPVPPRTSELGRRLVQDSKNSYNGISCAPITGTLPLPTSPVPTPSLPTPTPTPR